MAKITTRIGSHEIEVEIPDNPNIASCCGCIHPIIDAELDNCEIPDPETEVVEIPKLPVVTTTPPDSTLEVPISVIASLLPCDYPGLGPCPVTIYHPVEEMDETPEDVEPITIHFDYGGEEMASGDLYLVTEVVSHCCCEAEEDDEGKIDKVHFYPKYKWVSRKWRVTDWRRMYGPVTVVTNPLCSCISKKTMIMNSVEVRLAGSKWETRNPIAQEVTSFFDESMDENRLTTSGCPTTEEKEVLYRVFIDQCKFWKQNAKLEYVCGRLYNFTLMQPESLGPNTQMDIDYVSPPKLVCESSASQDTECACTASIEFTHKRLHIEGLCLIASEIEKVNIQLPYIEYLGQPTLSSSGTSIVFPRNAVNWCQYADEIRRGGDGALVDASYCHCNLPPYNVPLPVTKAVKVTGGCNHGGCTESYNLVMNTGGVESYVMSNGQPFVITQDTWNCNLVDGGCITPLTGKYSIIVDLSEEKDESNCKIKIHGYRQYWTFCCGRLVSIEAASTVDLVTNICECDCSEQSEEPSSEEPSSEEYSSEIPSSEEYSSEEPSSEEYSSEEYSSEEPSSEEYSSEEPSSEEYSSEEYSSEEYSSGEPSSEEYSSEEYSSWEPSSEEYSSEIPSSEEYSSEEPSSWIPPDYYGPN